MKFFKWRRLSHFKRLWAIQKKLHGFWEKFTTFESIENILERIFGLNTSLPNAPFWFPWKQKAPCRSVISIKLLCNFIKSQRRKILKRQNYRKYRNLPWKYVNDHGSSDCLGQWQISFLVLLSLRHLLVHLGLNENYFLCYRKFCPFICIYIFLFFTFFVGNVTDY